MFIQLLNLIFTNSLDKSITHFENLNQKTYHNCTVKDKDFFCKWRGPIYWSLFKKCSYWCKNIQMPNYSVKTLYQKSKTGTYALSLLERDEGTSTECCN